MSEFGDRIHNVDATGGTAIDLGRGVVQGATDPGATVGCLKSREGRSMVNRVARGVFDMLKK